MGFPILEENVYGNCVSLHCFSYFLLDFYPEIVLFTFEFHSLILHGLGNDFLWVLRSNIMKICACLVLGFAETDFRLSFSFGLFNKFSNALSHRGSKEFMASRSSSSCR